MSSVVVGGGDGGVASPPVPSVVVGGGPSTGGSSIPPVLFPPVPLPVGGGIRIPSILQIRQLKYRNTISLSDVMTRVVITRVYNH